MSLTGQTPDGKKRQVDLQHALRMILPTLTVHGNYNRAGLSATSGNGLATSLRELLPTLAARDWRSGPCRSANGHSPQLPEVLGGMINPPWAELFMGYPPGWTDPGGPAGGEG